MSFVKSLIPRELDDFVGNEHIFGPDGYLIEIFHQTIERNCILPSLILHGPPGTGKTSFARMYIPLFRQFAEKHGYKITHNYNEKNFDSNTYNKNDLESFLKNAESTIAVGKVPVVFVDEFHTLTKTQEATFLTFIEKEEIVFLGATTEPLFKRVQEGIRSRCKVFEFELLRPDEGMQVLINALNRLQPLNPSMPETQQIESPDLLAQLCMNFYGDCRRLISMLETAIDKNGVITQESVNNAIIEYASFTGHYENYHYDLISGLHKSLRASDPNGSIFFLVAMLETGNDPLYICRRMIITAVEDIGIADPNALRVAVDTYRAVEILGMPEGQEAMAECCIYLAMCKKNNSSYVALLNAQKYLQEKRLQFDKQLPREGYRNEPNATNYKYPHDFGGYILDQVVQDEVQQQVFWVDESRGMPQ